MKKNCTKALALFCASILLLGGCASGGAGNTKDIGEAKAKEIVFEHANVEEKNVQSLTVKKGKEDGTNIYSIQFYTEDTLYDYQVNRSDGDIITSSYEHIVTANAKGEQTTDKTETSDKTNNNNGSDAKSITKDEAKAIALEHAGVKESDTQRMKIQNDWEDGQDIYSVEFHSGNKEYDYEISKQTGTILKFDHDIERSSNTASGNSNLISQEEAGKIALKKVSGATTQHMYIELERDDGMYIYEGEIVYDNKEYEFEIDATTGNIIKWEVEYLR